MLTRNDRIECAECRQKVKAQTARDRTPIPLEQTPIYTQLKIEQQREVLKPFMKAAGEAFQRIVDAFKPFVEHVIGVWKQMQRYDMSSGQPVRRPGMKPLLKNGRKP